MHHRLMLFDALFPVHISNKMYQHMKQWLRRWSAQHILIHTPPSLLIADSIYYSTWSKTFQQSHRHKLPTNSTQDTTQLSHSDSPNFWTPHTEGQEQVQSHNSHKSAHHRTYQISPNTTPPEILTPNSSTYTIQEASGRERFYGKNLNKCPQKIPKNSHPREQSIPLTL